MGEFKSRSVKTQDAVEGFHLRENSHKLCQGFQQAMEARTSCVNSFIKLLFSVLIKRKTIYEARTVNSHNSSNHIAHVILVLHSAMKTHLLTNQKPTYYPNYFIKQHENTLVNQSIKLGVLSKMFL